MINDAAYLGKMTVTSDFLGIHGYYKNDEIVVVPQKNAEISAARIKVLMEDKYKRNEIAHKARTRVNDFTIESFYNHLKTELFTLV